MPPRVERVPRPDWEPLPYEGCRGAEGDDDHVMVERTQSDQGDA